MLKLQNHKCAICELDEVDSLHGKLSVDHCHRTGKIRGLLCVNCNTAIGKLKDSDALLQKAINYLVKHRESTVNSI